MISRKTLLDYTNYFSPNDYNISLDFRLNKQMKHRYYLLK